MNIECKVSLGELVDKISILKIKTQNISDETKVAHAQKEHDVLRAKLDQLNLEGIEDLHDELIAINSELWKIEDDIREKERQKQFDEDFIDLARRVYITNDKRFDVKNKINSRFDSDIVEVKSYEKY